MKNLDTNANANTPSYVELSGQTYALWIDAISAANHRYLGYVKSLYDIGSRPYASSAVETNVRENFERAHQVVELTVNELQTTGQKTAEFSEKLATHTAKLQDSWMHSLRGLLKTGISNISYVKDTAETSLDGFAKRVDEMQSRATTVSSN
jgi:hypothetical protein